SGLQKILPQPVMFIYGLSPDGRMLGLWEGDSVFVYDRDTRISTFVCHRCGTAGEENRGLTPPLLAWSADGRFMYLHSPTIRQTFAVPIPPGELLPRFPADGVPSMAEASTLPGARPLSQLRAFAGGDPSIFAFLRVTAHRNIYRISVP